LRLPPSSTLFPYTTLFRSQVRYGLSQYVKTNHALPKAVSYEDLLNTLKPNLGRARFESDCWAADYQAEFTRFSTGEAHKPFLTRSEEHTSELQSPYDLVCR